MLSVKGTARVPRDGTTYEVRVDLSRRSAQLPLVGLVTVTDVRSGAVAAAVAPLPRTVTATRQADGSLLVGTVLPGLYKVGRTAPQAVSIGLTVTDR